MDATPSSTMVGDFSIRSTGSNFNSNKFNSANAQKGRRLDNIAARLQPNRASTSSSPLPNGTSNKKAATTSPSGSSKIENTSKITCHQCLLIIKPAGNALMCIGCKKHAHEHCVTIPLTKDNQYLCPHCRKHSQQASTSVQNDVSPEHVSENEIEKPVTRRQALSNSTSSGSAVTSSPPNQLTPTSSATNSSSSTPVATPQPATSRKSSIPPSSLKYYPPPLPINTDLDSDQLPAQMPTGSSFTSSVDEDFSNMINSEEHSVTSSPSPIDTASNSARDSPLSRYEDSNDTSSGSRPVLQRRSTKETNAGNKPKASTSATTGKRGRQTSMKTRSGGQPSGKSYATMGKVTTGKRKPSVKGKGKSGNAPKNRRQRNTNKLSLIKQISRAIGRENEDPADPDEPKTRQPDENDYIVTPIVSDAENDYVCTAPMCYVCGSIGRDVEGTMLSCMSCAQSYHSYCVNMHDKLNKTILKRGWRCLKCTVCEVCGNGSDEPNLLLCDECDVAFHIYCLEPKLNQIPSGSWRCHWCAMCRRCNKQVQAGFDLQELEGYCEPCHSLRKCLKCSKVYSAGDLIIKCQHCLRWCHGPCEDLNTEEQLDNAYENAFRCSSCRPKANSDYNDGMNQCVIIDGVMVNKQALEMLRFGRSSSSLGNLADITGSFRSQSIDQGDAEDAIMEEIDFSSGRGRNRTSGPGRRPPKIGIGGFFVKNRNRVTQSVEDEPQEDKEELGPNKKRRPRKPRRHQLEDAYPVAIQSAFWGGITVDGKNIFEIPIGEPILVEDSSAAASTAQQNKKGKEIYELSDQASENLRSQQEQDMIGDFIGANIDIDDMDMESFDFSDLLGDEDDDMLLDFPPSDDTQDSLQSSSQLDSIDTLNQSHLMQERQRMEHHRQLMARASTKDAEQRATQASEKWAEDEPLGDKATKAAVLHANLKYPKLKIEFPNWNDRVKQIHRLWRNLKLDQRQEYVQKARENRACRTRLPRRRGVAGKPGSKESTGIGMKEEDTSTMEFETKPSSYQSTEVKTEGSQQPNGIHPESYSNGVMTQHQQLVRQDSTQGKDPVTQMQQQSSTFGASYQQKFGSNSPLPQNGVLNKNQANTNGTSTMRPSVPTEVLERYENLKKEQGVLREQQSKIETEVATLRKNKKTLTAKKRALNKNALMNEEGQPIIHNLAPEDQTKWDDISATLAERTKVIEKMKRNSKELQSQIDHLTNEYHIGAAPSPTPSVFGGQGHHASTSLAALRTIPDTSGPLSVGTPSTAGTPGILSPSTRFSFSRSISIPAPSSACSTPGVVLSNGGMLSRADSVASLTSDSGLDALQPAKPTRGRKRKNKIEHTAPLRRSAKLGHVFYNLLQDDIDRDVYDTLDNVLYRLTVCDDSAPNTDLRRLLMTHAPIDESSVFDFDVPKKKKRANNKKSTPLNESNELESLIENVQASLAALPSIPTSALNPLPSFDPAILVTKEHTKLLENNEDSPLGEVKFGSVGLSFMDDFYNEFEDCCNVKYRKHNLPISCSKFYNSIVLDPYEEELWAQAEEQLAIYGEYDTEPFKRLDCPNELPRDDYDQITIDRIKEREGMDYVIPFMGRWPEVEISMDPPRSAYFWRNYPNAIELDLVLDHDEELPTNEILSQLASILNPQQATPEDIDYELGPAPVLSPGTDSCPDYGENGQIICCTCRIPISGESFKIDLNEAYQQYDHYCSQQCYELRNANDENWNEKAAAQEPSVKSPLAIRIEEEEENEPPPESPENEEPCLNEYDFAVAIESLRQPREMEYTSIIDLPQTVTPSPDKTPGGSRSYKYKGQGWMVCDENLLSSFKAQNEDMQETVRRHCGNWQQITAKDTRRCAFCMEIGDGRPTLTGRLLNVDANEWVHVNCAVWSVEVHESECGGLNNVQAAIKQSRGYVCDFCNHHGASLKCIKLDCEAWYHLPCAYTAGCAFMKDKSIACSGHNTNVHDEVVVQELLALRRIYIEREENALLAKIYNNSFSHDMMMRVGNLIFYHIGQLLPEQIKSFHNNNYIFPVNYRVVRFFWHPTHVHELTGYECVIEERDNAPLFRVSFEGRDLRDTSPHLAWHRILLAIQQLRDKHKDVLRFFPSQVTGEGLYGFHESSVTKMVESLPGLHQLHTYDFKHGGEPLMEVPLAINPTGCARTEPCFRTLIKARKNYYASPQKMEDRPSSCNSMIGSGRRRRRPANDLGNVYDEATLKLLKFSGISDDMLASGTGNSNGQAQLYTRYKTMKKEWRSFVALGRSGIAGFGLYAKKDIDMHQMVCEYVGEIIRSEVCEVREKKYAQKNKGIYMFRIDSEYVIDATMTGNMARYINHSCDPNCFTQIVNIDNNKKIVIIASRPIRAGEELTYDYQFELEEAVDKIPCLCGAPNCVKWMN